MKKYRDYPEHVRNLIDKIDKFFLEFKGEKKDFVAALGFLINKYKAKKNVK